MTRRWRLTRRGEMVATVLGTLLSAGLVSTLMLLVTARPS